MFHKLVLFFLFSYEIYTDSESYKLQTDEQFIILMDINLIKDTADVLYSAYCKWWNAVYK